MRPDYDQVYYDCKAIETFMDQAAQSGMFENIEQAAKLKRSFDNVKAVVIEARNPKDFEQRIQALSSIHKGLYSMAGELGRLFPQADCAQCISAGSGDMMKSEDRGERLSAELDPHSQFNNEGQKFNGANMQERDVVAPRKEGVVRY